MYSAGNDWLADPQDVKLLVENLQPSILKSHTEIPPWMHLDFIWGMNAPQLIYHKIIKEMKMDLRTERFG